MPPNELTPRAARARLKTVMPRASIPGFLAAVVAVLLIALFSYLSLEARWLAAHRVTSTLSVIEKVEGLASLAKDAETGQRGYLLTGSDAYLQPYTEARRHFAGDLQALRDLTTDAMQRKRLDELELLLTAKFSELQLSIDLHRSGDASSALTLVKQDTGKHLMEQIRVSIAQIQDVERRELADRQEAWQQAASFSTLITWGGSVILLALIVFAAYATAKDHQSREIEVWLRTGQVGVSGRMQGDQRLDRLGESVLKFLVDYLDAQVGAFYVVESDGTFRQFASFGVPESARREVVSANDGLLAQAARDQRAMWVRNVPEGYLPVGSSLGQRQSREVLIAPAIAGGRVQAVLELGFFHVVHESDTELLTRVCELVGAAIRGAKDRTRLEELLEETQRQTEELETQQEECGSATRSSTSRGTRCATPGPSSRHSRPSSRPATASFNSSARASKSSKTS